MIGNGIIDLLFDDEFFNPGAIEEKIVVRIQFGNLRISLDNFSIYTGNGTLFGVIAAAFDCKCQSSYYNDVFHAGTRSKLMPCET